MSISRLPTNYLKVQRAIHIHVQIHTSWTVLSNGTLAHGAIVSTGQIFMDELLSRQLMALEPYVNHTEIERVENADDGIYNQESSSKWFSDFGLVCLRVSGLGSKAKFCLAGAMTLLDTEPLGREDYAKGVFGYITLVRQINSKD
ncbi:hypothetical protein ACJZ2D_010081 [Fusarium nematophilum]